MRAGTLEGTARYVRPLAALLEGMSDDQAWSALSGGGVERRRRSLSRLNMIVGRFQGLTCHAQPLPKRTSGTRSKNAMRFRTHQSPNLYELWSAIFIVISARRPVVQVYASSSSKILKERCVSKKKCTKSLEFVLNLTEFIRRSQCA